MLDNQKREKLQSDRSLIESLLEVRNDHSKVSLSTMKQLVEEGAAADVESCREVLREMQKVVRYFTPFLASSEAELMSDLAECDSKMEAVEKRLKNAEEKLMKIQREMRTEIDTAKRIATTLDQQARSAQKLSEYAPLEAQLAEREMVSNLVEDVNAGRMTREDFKSAKKVLRAKTNFYLNNLEFLLGREELGDVDA